MIYKDVLLNELSAKFFKIKVIIELEKSGSVLEIERVALNEAKEKLELGIYNILMAIDEKLNRLPII